MSIRYASYHIHGDNIVECERAVALIRTALGGSASSWTGPTGSPTCPRYGFTLDGEPETIWLTLLPGFGRWNEDILEAIRARGGGLREAADVIVAGIAPGEEDPLLAIEFCGALPAGNQAWQRSGRAFSFAQAGIPYLYVAELGGYELGAGRERKAARLPNPAVPFSYLSFSLTAGTPTLPVFVPSPGADVDSRRQYAAVFAEDELMDVVRATLLGGSIDHAVARARAKALAFVEIKARASRRGATLTPSQWDEAYASLLSGRGLLDYLAMDTSIRWSKVTSIPLTRTAAQLMEAAAESSVGLTAKDLPMCVVPRRERDQFAVQVENIYGARLSATFKAWLRRKEHLAICWVMGFKPGHDDARPDRGLPPLTRMLVGPGTDLLTVVYGPAAPSSWQVLDLDPQRLMRDNGLWEAVMSISDAVLGDALTDGVNRHGYVRAHWSTHVAVRVSKPAPVEPSPKRLGENDVDTVIHLLMARLAGPQVFEGLCNPPGGDWSGISLQNGARSKELRWLTLPRVGEGSAKRPDHVLQLFNGTTKPIVLSVESKERASSVESGIGPRLNRYIETLLETPASIERLSEVHPWAHSTEELDLANFRLASAVAYVADRSSDQSAMKQHAGVDLILCVEFGAGGGTCRVRLIAASPIGKEIAGRIALIDGSALGITIAIQ